MTAPADIGLEQNDATSRMVQGDMFDPGMAEKKMCKGQSVSAFIEDVEDDTDLYAHASKAQIRS